MMINPATLDCWADLEALIYLSTQAETDDFSKQYMEHWKQHAAYCLQVVEAHLAPLMPTDLSKAVH